MCRIAAYFGPPRAVSTVLLEPAHSLLEQSRAAREMHGGRVAGDGWGIGWFTQAGQAGLLKNILPIWSDQNAKTTMPAIVSGSFIGHIRLASDGIETCLLNTAVYQLDDYLFTINGGIEPWGAAIARAIRARLSEKAEAALNGSSDGELIAALWRTHLGQVNRADPGMALRDALEQLVGLCQEHGCSFTANMIVANAEGLSAVRFAFNQEPNSLYRLANQTRWKEAYLVASEPLDDEEGWESIDPAMLVRVDKGGMRIIALYERGAAPPWAVGIEHTRKSPSAPIRNGKGNATARRK